MSWQHGLILFLASALGGAVNSVAGGGTLLTFPTLLWVLGPQYSVVANATSTVALWPGQLSSLWGYRSELGRSRTAMLVLGAPSLIGGIIGAELLLHTSPGTFNKLVPFLILLATLLFMAQEPVSRAQRRRAERLVKAADLPSDPLAAPEDGPAEAAGTPGPIPPEELRKWAVVMLYQLGVAVYGGYFGAGIGILMLAALGFMGFTNIHQMNGLKNLNGLCINFVAALLFIVSGLVRWPTALLMACGAILGGYGGAGTARRIGQRNVRRIIIGIGFALALSLLAQNLLKTHSSSAPAPARAIERNPR